MADQPTPAELAEVQRAWLVADLGGTMTRAQCFAAGWRACQEWLNERMADTDGRDFGSEAERQAWYSEAESLVSPIRRHDHVAGWMAGRDWATDQLDAAYNRIRDRLERAIQGDKTSG